MSDQTFRVPADILEGTVSLHCKCRPLCFTDEHTCTSTDFKSSRCGTTESVGSLPDVCKTQCFDESSSDIYQCSNPPSHSDVLYADSDLNQTFVVTPGHSSIGDWCKSFTNCVGTGGDLKECQVLKKCMANANEERISAEIQVGSNRTFVQGSNEIDCCSPSSLEMRHKSFCLQDQSLIVFSSMDDSSVSPARCRTSPLADPSPQSQSLTDACVRPTEGAHEENSAPPYLGVTFIKEDDRTPLSDDVIKDSSGSLTSPCEGERCLLTTFICDTPTDIQNETKLAHKIPENLRTFSAGVTPEEFKPLASVASVTQDDDGIFTSTPVQNARDEPHSKLSISPSIAGIQPLKSQTISVSSDQFPPPKMPLSLRKVKKIDVKSTGKAAQTAPGVTPQQKPFTRKVQSDVKKILAKMKTSSVVTPVSSKTRNDPRNQVNTGAANFGVRQSSERQASDAQSKNKQSSTQPHPTSNKRNAAHETAHVSQKPPNHVQQTPAAFPQKAVWSRIEDGSAASVNQDKTPNPKTQARCVSDTLTRRPPEGSRTQKAASSPSVSERDPASRPHKKILHTSSVKTEESSRSSDNSSREVKKISLVKGLCKSKVAGAPQDLSKGSGQEAGAPLAQLSSVGTRSTLLLTKQKQVTQGRTQNKVSSISGVTQSLQKSNSGVNKPPGKETFSSGIKSQPNASQPPTRPRGRTSPASPASRPPGRTLAPLVSGGDAPEQPRFKRVLREKVTSSFDGKPSKQGSTGVLKSSAATGKEATVVPLKRNNSTRFPQPVSNDSSGKNKGKANSFSQPQSLQVNQRTENGSGQQTKVSQAQQDEDTQELKRNLTTANNRFQALAIVLQQSLSQLDEVSQERWQISQELVNLREELVSSVSACERLEKEKDELRLAEEDALQKLQEEHQKDLLELEQSLQAAHQAKLDTMRLTFQEESEQSRTLYQQQIEQLMTDHQTVKLELERSHAEQLQQVQQQHQLSLEDLRKSHSQDLLSLNKTLKDAEVSLFKQVTELAEENSSLVNKLSTEERRKRHLASTNQKDAHILYLEQELQSLKAVLEMKTQQLNLQKKKLTEYDKLLEKTTKLDESLYKVQQENEHLKARMERHAALSRQLSTEQAMLQESLQKESKVNKRLSMENEELLWKLHNGDLTSPRKLSPTSASNSFGVKSPRSSGIFSSPPLSPR